MLLWRVKSGGYDHSELPEELSHPKATWIVDFLTGSSGGRGFTLPDPHFEIKAVKGPPGLFPSLLHDPVMGTLVHPGVRARTLPSTQASMSS